jgi:Uma2 family endonuclease
MSRRTPATRQSGHDRRSTIDVATYFERTEQRELIYGHVRELGLPPRGRDRVVSLLMQVLLSYRSQHVDTYPCPLPDVVLSEKDALVLHPALAIVIADRLSLLRERIWGPPNVVVEVIDQRHVRRTRLSRMGWYRRHGVEECWLVDPRTKKVDVVDFEANSLNVPNTYHADAVLRSRVLSGFSVRVAEIV